MHESDDPMIVSATSHIEVRIRDVRRTPDPDYTEGAPYPANAVTITVRLWDALVQAPLGAAIPASYDTTVGAWVAIIPPVSVPVGGRVMVEETITASGRTRVYRTLADVVD